MKPRRYDTEFNEGVGVLVRLKHARVVCRARARRMNSPPNCLWPPYVIGQAIIFLPCGFYLSSSFFFLFFLVFI